MLTEACNKMVTCIRNGNKILVFGVGGNAATAIHMVAELAGKYEEFEIPYAAVCLSDNPSILTAITNDFGWDQVFSRQIQGLGKPGDVVIGFSISGSGLYLENALRTAKKNNCWTVLINGVDHPPCSKLCDEIVAVGSKSTPYVQEEQLKLVHYICGRVKRELSQNLVKV